ncbi:MAG: DVU0150 family protein [Pseudomonadota bacterium]
MKTASSRLLLFAGLAALLLPELLWAAEGGAEMLVVVADTRQVSSGVNLYLLDLYNTNPMGFGLLCVIVTTVLGCGLGIITDFVMKRTGIDLKSRKIVEH